MMSETNITLTFETQDEAIKAMKILTEVIDSTEPSSDNELIEFKESIDIEKNIINVYTCCLYCGTLTRIMPEVVRKIAENSKDENFELFAEYDSLNDGYTELVEASYTNHELEIKTFISENGCPSCPECCEQIVCLDEYDPNETYYCPECGEELDHLEMFDGCLPEISIENITIE